MNAKYYLFLYFLTSLFASTYIHTGARTILEFLGTTLVTFLFFVGVYFCFRNIRQSRLSIKLIRVVAILLCAVGIYALYTYANFRQFNSWACRRDLVGVNIFTQKSVSYCNFIPWYAKSAK